jgi:simple sugar transport system ATP-binding protein
MMNPSLPSEPVIAMANISRRFGSIVAVEDVTLAIYAGEVTALVGDNGAGKSTLIKILTGVYPPTTGQIYFKGKPVQITSPRMARQLGIETVYQDLALVPLMSVARNFFLGREPVKTIGPFRFLDLKTMQERTAAALRDIGIEKFGGGRSVNEPVGKLSGGERQSVAIGRAVYFGASVLILDEPTSALSVAETEKVLFYTQRAKERGLAVIFISHNMSHVMRVADRYIVMRHGRQVADYRKGELTEQDLAALVTGEREK